MQEFEIYANFGKNHRYAVPLIKKMCFSNYDTQLIDELSENISYLYCLEFCGHHYAFYFIKIRYVFFDLEPFMRSAMKGHFLDFLQIF